MVYTRGLVVEWMKGAKAGAPRMVRSLSGAVPGTASSILESDSRPQSPFVHQALYFHCMTPLARERTAPPDNGTTLGCYRVVE
jgi:hypothetical protein